MLFRKMRRDLMQNKVQFLSIFLMSLLGIFVFAGLDSEASGMEKYEAVYYEKTGLADLWVQGKDALLEIIGQLLTPAFNGLGHDVTADA